MTPTYPKRPAFFANKAVRAMVKTCVAQEHGQGVFSLLCVIAHTEDARHYTSPVTFWNEQLAAVAGFANVKAMDRQRTKAVESGWLVYIPGGNRTPGKYWVCIPPKFSDLDDNPSDEGAFAIEEAGTSNNVQTSNLTNEVGNEPGMKWESNRDRSGVRTGNEVGNEPGSNRAPFYPIPNPNPVPKEPPLPPEGGSVAKATRKNAITSLDGIAVPEPLDTPEHRNVLGQWLAYRVEVGKPYRAASAVQSLLAFWAKHPGQLAEAVRTSMANQWQGLFVPDPARRGRAGPPPAGPGQKFEGEKAAGIGEF